jgi:lipopolysaccharide biosynthesis protein
MFSHSSQRGLEVARVPTPFAAHVKSATAVEIDCRKVPAVQPETSLFVSHSSDGHLKPHVRHYIEALVHEGIGVILIVNSDQGFTDDEPWLHELVDGLFVRANEGFDFAAWAHVLRLHPQLCRVKLLYLLNDSVIGPITKSAFHAAIERVRRSPGDLIGMTENYELGWHIQSYFLAVRARAMRTAAWRRFTRKIGSLSNKDDVVKTYEVQLASAMTRAGLKSSVVFKTEFRSDPTVYRWKELLEDGFPFVKVKAIRDEIPGVDKADWRQTLAAFGFDVSIADDVLSRDPITATRTNGR